MVKRHTTLNIEDNLLKKAKENCLNISVIAEKAIKDKLNLKEVQMDISIDKCEFCGREDEKATKNNLNGLCWLSPDEKWICKFCLKRKTLDVARGKLYV